MEKKNYNDDNGYNIKAAKENVDSRLRNRKTVRKKKIR